jgi:diguanylate cyclase (GGDEF)-like protein
MESIESAVRQILNWLHIPGHLHLFVILGLANLVSLAIGILVGRNSGWRAKAAVKVPMPKRQPLESDWGDDLQQQVKILRDQNQHYRYFMVSFPRILKHLNTTSNVVDMAKSIVRLASDAMQTDNVQLYVYREKDSYLEKLYSIGHDSDDIKGFEVDRGIVGRAAKDLAIVNFMNEDDEGRESGAEEDETGLTMAGPIIYEGILVGVLGIGRITYPTGDESSLLRMFCEIAGVSLYSHSYLGHAKMRAATDPLTGLYNRRHFFETSRDHIKKVATSGGCISFFLFDIDSFKNYNDLNGHGEGDKLLKELSAILLKGSRESNVVARYGGEEFIVMLKDVSKENTSIYAQRLCDKIAAHPFAHRENQPFGMVTISGGVATYPLDGDSVEEVIRHPDAALYRAKRGGRHRIEAHNPTPLHKEDEEGPAVVP